MLFRSSGAGGAASVVCGRPPPHIALSLMAGPSGPAERMQGAGECCRAVVILALDPIVQLAARPGEMAGCRRRSSVSEHAAAVRNRRVVCGAAEEVRTISDGWFSSEWTRTATEQRLDDVALTRPTPTLSCGFKYTAPCLDGDEESTSLASMRGRSAAVLDGAAFADSDEWVGQAVCSFHAGRLPARTAVLPND